MRLSIWLNDFENYRTESEYRTYLIIKVFYFRFVNYFATLYYYAFVSSIVSEEEQDMQIDVILNGVLRVGFGSSDLHYRDSMVAKCTADLFSFVDPASTHESQKPAIDRRVMCCRTRRRKDHSHREGGKCREDGKC